MTVDDLVTIEGKLRDTYRQLRPGSMQHVDQLMDQRRINPITKYGDDLRNLTFYAADGVIYLLEGINVKDPYLVITREPHNPFLKNIDDALDQFTKNRNYPVLEKDSDGALKAKEKKVISLRRLRLFDYDEEFSYLLIGTNGTIKDDGGGFEVPNQEEQALMDRFGFTSENLAMLKNAKISETRIYVLNPVYVRKHAEKGPIARASWLGNFNGGSQFSAVGRDIIFYSRVRGVRRGSAATEAPIGATLEKPEKGILQPVTKELLLPIARPYISGYDWETFSGHIPDQAPALGDVMLAAHKDGFVCAHSTPEFDQQIRNLYFPPPPKKEEKK